MKIAVTGGGTGGHIYPALEVARELRDRGVEVVYIGSLRGPEGARAAEAGFEFHGLPALPLLSLRTPKGWKGLAALLRSTVMARSLLPKLGVDRVFGTGGYGAGPVVAAARGLKIPFVLHESNSIPGRANRAFAAQAKAISCVFHRTLSEFPSAVRTGQPIRKELRAVAAGRQPRQNFVLATGGSQGSVFLNRLVPQAAALLPGFEWLQAIGPKNPEVASPAKGYKAVPYLETAAMAEAYCQASVAIGRSGGTLAEYALFRLPSVLIPLPTSADDHQLHNAKEFVEMGAAILLDQSKATPQKLADAVASWGSDAKVAAAAKALAEWDAPDATERIADLVLR